MTSTMSTTVTALPVELLFDVMGNAVHAPVKPTKAGTGYWYQAKLIVPITSGRSAEEILDASVVLFQGEPMNRGDRHLSKVNEDRGYGGNPTICHSEITKLGGIAYQLQVFLTGITEKDGTPSLQVVCKAFRRPSTTVGSMEGQGF